MNRILRTALTAVAVLAAPLAGVNAQPTQTVFSYSSSANTTTLLLNGTTDIAASVRGWYTSSGENNGSSSGNNFIAGTCGTVACGGDGSAYRNWFQFNLANFTPTVTSAVLLLNNPSEGFFNELGASLGYNLFDITTGFAGLGGVTSAAVFNDLGTGTQYGSTNVTSAQNGTTIAITLNAAALASLNTGRQDGLWAVGGNIGTTSVVPEPSTYALMIAGLAGIAIAGRARRRAQ